MKINSAHWYEYDPDANLFAGVLLSMDDDPISIQTYLSDQQLLSQWTSLNFIIPEDNPPTNGDFPSLTNYRKLPVCTKAAWNVLSPLIGYCCEPLPLIHPSGTEYFIIHVMETIDALDTSRSDFLRSQIGDCRILRIYNYSFNQSLIVGKHIFKLPILSGGDLFVSSDFRRIYEESGLRGLRFRELPMSK